MTSKNQSHAAEGAALGFYYQTLYALLTLLEMDTDDAAISIEQLDDIELKIDGQKLLYQLKHSIIPTPPPISLKSRSLWRTMKAWIDVLPQLTISETTFHLVTVAGIPNDSPLRVLVSFDMDREELVKAMEEEAQHVIDERKNAKKSKKPLPYSDRFEGCEAFLALTETDRLNILRRTLIKTDSPTVGEIEELVTTHLRKLVPSEMRPSVAQRLIEWWDRQIIYTLCGKRPRVITKAEQQHEVTIIIGDIEQDRIFPDFETVSQPSDYQPDGMLTRQIQLVEGRNSDLSKAIREEWKAREQRAKWLNEKPSMATVIGNYDLVLQEHWADRHSTILEECCEAEDKEKRSAGLKLLRWTHNEAPNILRPIVDGWNVPYYVRGSYQVLAINLKVGWHPDYNTILGSDK